jgi:hypothetical protein
MINSKKPLYYILACTLVLTACSSKEKPKVEEFFHTNIRDDGSKEFAFSLMVSANNKVARKETTGPSKKTKQGGRKSRGQKARNSTPSNSSKKSMTDKVQGVFQERLTFQLESSQYCREGYLTLDKSFVGAIYTLRGECHESATEEDRKRFTG